MDWRKLFSNIIPGILSLLGVLSVIYFVKSFIKFPMDVPLKQQVSYVEGLVLAFLIAGLLKEEMSNYIEILTQQDTSSHPNNTSMLKSHMFLLIQTAIASILIIIFSYWLMGQLNIKA